MTVLQWIQHADWRCSSCEQWERNRGVRLKSRSRICLLPVGKKDWGTEMNDYFEDRLQMLEESRPAEPADMSNVDIEEILEIWAPLRGGTAGNPKKLVLWALTMDCVIVWLRWLKFRLRWKIRTPLIARTSLVFWTCPPKVVFPHLPPERRLRLETRKR